MKWSFQKPSAPGYFWMRDRKRGWTEVVVEVEAQKKMGLLGHKELRVEDDPVVSMPITVEWAGPIAPPDESDRREN